MSDMRIHNASQFTIASSGDIGAQVAALQLESAATQKKGARETRDMEAQALEAAEEQEVNAIRAQASDALSHAVLNGLGSIAKGVGSIAGGALEARAAGKGEVQRHALEAKAKVWEGAGVAAEGTHTLLAAGSSFDQKMDEAAEKRASIAAQHAKSGLDDAKDAIDDAKRLADKAIDFYKEWTQGAAGAMQASLHRS